MSTCTDTKVKLCKNKGKVCNKKTGRCKKGKPVKCGPKKVKLCNSKGKICNPKTGRCKKKGKLTKPTSSTKPKPISSTKPKPTGKCKPKKIKLCNSKGKICNPKTGRCKKGKLTKPTSSTKPKPTSSTKPKPTSSTKPKPTSNTKPMPTSSTKPKPTSSTKPKPTSITKPTGKISVSSLKKITPYYTNSIFEPPKFSNIKGYVSLVYYDLKINGKRKRILFCSEFHEFKFDLNFMDYINSLNAFIKTASKGKDCLDIHVEIPRTWTTVKNKNYKQKGKGNLSKIAALPEYKKTNGLRFHTDDVRSFGEFIYGSPLNRPNYGNSKFNFNADEMLALVYGVGPLTNSNGDILPKYVAKLKSTWQSIPSLNQYKHLSWNDLINKNKPRARKSMLLFMKEYNISMKKLYPVLKGAVIYSMRGLSWTQGFGYEAMNDIYSLFRMFRTFKNKRKKPCVDGFQHNIIYISHIGHAQKIMYMMNKLFKIKPNYIESIHNSNFKKLLQQTFNISTDKLRYHSNLSSLPTFCPGAPQEKSSPLSIKCDTGLGKAITPLFFA